MMSQRLLLKSKSLNQVFTRSAFPSSSFLKSPSSPFLKSPSVFSSSVLKRSSPGNTLQNFRFAHTLHPLKYGTKKGIRPIIGVKALDSHYNDIMSSHIRNLNKLSIGTPYELANLEEIVAATSGKANEAAIFNEASSVWNHIFFFDGLIPGGQAPSNEMKQLIDIHFENIDNLKLRWKQLARGLFGNGWIWLTYNQGQLELYVTHVAGSPLLFGENIIPILGLDMWEHAYYYEYMNNKELYIENFFNSIDWKVVEERLVQAQTQKKRE